MIRASYLQIYNEVITDLLKKEPTPLQIRENKKKGEFVGRSFPISAARSTPGAR
jgi:hypothetical protein